jgi:hypothetical protein
MGFDGLVRLVSKRDAAEENSEEQAWEGPFAAPRPDQLDDDGGRARAAITALLLIGGLSVATVMAGRDLSAAHAIVIGAPR